MIGRRLLAISAEQVRTSSVRRLNAIQKARQWRAFYAQKKEILWNRDWLAGDAVGFEPVSGMDSLLSGNFTGKFSIPDPRMPIQEQETAAPQRFLEYSPSKRTGTFVQVSGKFGQVTGKLSRFYVSSDFLQGPNLVFGTHSCNQGASCNPFNHRSSAADFIGSSSAEVVR